MKNEKKKESYLFRFFYLSFLTSYFLLLISLSACGRRGDPVAVLPQEEKAVAADLNQEGEREDASVSTKTVKDMNGTDESEGAVPDSPAGLDALYTQKSVILTWDEVIDQGVTYYRIYRSHGKGFELVGDSVTPAFTDRNIEKNTEYFYRVTAFGSDESQPSEEIDIFTGVH